MNLHKEIQAVFQQRDDIPLFYIENGSRLWGMASPDSDYDVRGFHLPSKKTYFDYKQHRDLIEIMDGDFDFVSFNLDKAFGLLAKSNPTVLEWVRAHIEYFNDLPDWGHFRHGLLEKVDYSALYYHYLSLALRGMKVMEKSEENFTYKKVFYSIRGLISAELACQQHMPKLFMTSLFQQVDEHDSLRQWAECYLDIKRQSNERSLVPEKERIEIMQLMNEKMAYLQTKTKIERSEQQRLLLENYLTDYSFSLKSHFYK